MYLYISRVPVVLLLIGFFIGISCNNQSSKKSKEHYIQEVNDWHQERINELKEEDSWLSVAGLYSLEEGVQSFGSDSSNDIIFPAKAPSKIGTITKEDSLFSVEIEEDISVIHDSADISAIELNPDSGGEASVLKNGSFFWYIIERRGTYYIRLKDRNHPNLLAFDGIERFPVSRDWRVKATFNEFEEAKTISIPDVLGQVYEDSLYGHLEFSIDGEQYSLAPLGHPEKDEEFFIILGDLTNGESTYGGGRYLYIPTPDKDGITYIDFNKTYNPPCVFTEYATCPLPPSQNRLDVTITAGEKMYDM